MNLGKKIKLWIKFAFKVVFSSKSLLCASLFFLFVYMLSEKKNVDIITKYHIRWFRNNWLMQSESNGLEELDNKKSTVWCEQSWGENHKGSKIRAHGPYKSNRKLLWIDRSLFCVYISLIYLQCLLNFLGWQTNLLGNNNNVTQHFITRVTSILYNHNAYG